MVLERLLIVLVKADDEPSHHLQARAGQAVHRLVQVEPQVLPLARPPERCGGGRLDAHEYRIASCALGLLVIVVLWSDLSRYALG